MTDTSALLLVKALSALRGEGLTLEQADLCHNRQRPLIKCPGLISRTLAENSELAKTVRVLFPDDRRRWQLEPIRRHRSTSNGRILADTKRLCTPAASKALGEH